MKRVGGSSATTTVLNGLSSNSTSQAERSSRNTLSPRVSASNPSCMRRYPLVWMMHEHPTHPDDRGT